MTTKLTLASALALSVLLAVGCDRDNPTPPDAGGPRDAGALDAGEPQDGGDTPIDAGTDAGDVDAGGCLAPTGCWDCPPSTSEQFLNACTSAACDPFPITTARLPRLRADGTVPPLP
ncbi:MAG: hypothetical protein KF729_13860 [Sandaracinaceae bacterium]|nr:hypothetical protein [Sandaracinaceae bacterium]